MTVSINNAVIMIWRKLLCSVVLFTHTFRLLPRSRHVEPQILQQLNIRCHAQFYVVWVHLAHNRVEQYFLAGMIMNFLCLISYFFSLLHLTKWSFGVQKIENAHILTKQNWVQFPRLHWLPWLHEKQKWEKGLEWGYSTGNFIVWLHSSGAAVLSPS